LYFPEELKSNDYNDNSGEVHDVLNLDKFMVADFVCKGKHCKITKLANAVILYYFVDCCVCEIILIVYLFER
jgi:hypothetical protein